MLSSLAEIHLRFEDTYCVLLQRGNEGSNVLSEHQAIRPHFHI